LLPNPKQIQSKYANITSKTSAEWVQDVLLSILPKQNLSSANIGCGVYARRESYANFYTNTTSKRCLNAGFTQSLENAQILNAYIFILIRNRKCLIVHGMQEDFASMVSDDLII
jgi:hypothetical protein